MQQRTRAWLIDRVCASRAQARWAEPPYRGRGVLGADFAGMGIVYWLVHDAEDAQAAVDTAQASVSALEAELSSAQLDLSPETRIDERVYAAPGRELLGEPREVR